MSWRDHATKLRDISTDATSSGIERTKPADRQSQKLRDVNHSPRKGHQRGNYQEPRMRMLRCTHGAGYCTRICSIQPVLFSQWTRNTMFSVHAWSLVASWIPQARRLTAAAAASQTEPRTAATGEVRLAAQCCHGRGELDQERDAPALPLPIIPGRPVGRRTCPRCRLTYSHEDNGARIQHHSCSNKNAAATGRETYRSSTKSRDPTPAIWCDFILTMCLRIPLPHGICGR